MEDLENKEISEEPIPVTAETDAAEAEQEEATYKEISPMRLVMRRFFRSKLSIVGIVMIAFLFLFRTGRLSEVGGIGDRLYAVPFFDRDAVHLYRRGRRGDHRRRSHRFRERYQPVCAAERDTPARHR